MPTITIRAPESKETLDEIYQLLDRLGVPYQEEPIASESQKEKLLQRYREQPRLTGHGDALAEMRQSFRDDFNL